MCLDIIYKTLKRKKYYRTERIIFENYKKKKDV